MKKLLAGLLTATLLLSAGTTSVFAGGHGHGRGHHAAAAPKTTVCASTHDGCSFSDTDHDGVCDNCGKNFTDKDGDGVCDNYKNGTGCKNGSGRGNGNGAGHGRGHRGGHCR